MANDFNHVQPLNVLTLSRIAKRVHNFRANCGKSFGFSYPDKLEYRSEGDVSLSLGKGRVAAILSEEIKSNIDVPACNANIFHVRRMKGTWAVLLHVIEQAPRLVHHPWNSSRRRSAAQSVGSDVTSKATKSEYNTGV